MYKHSNHRIYKQGKFMALQPELDLLSVKPNPLYPVAGHSKLGGDLLGEKRVYVCTV
jgi:hypothetical protein